MCCIPTTRCAKCTLYRKSLRTFYSRHQQQQPHVEEAPTTPSSHVNFRFLSPEQLRMRLRNVSAQKRTTAQALSRLRAKIQKSLQVCGVDVTESLHQDITTIMHECSTKALSDHPEESFARVFWQQQMQAAKVGGRQRRYHPSSATSLVEHTI